MRFSQTIHPERVLGKRERVDRFVSLYQHFLDNFICDENRYEKYGSSFAFNNNVVICPKLLPEKFFEEILSDSGWMEHFSLVKKFFMSGAKCYHVNKDFLEAISKVDKNIPVNLLPDDFCAYISFADEVLSDGEDQVEGAYVFLGPAKESIVMDASTPTAKVLWTSYICKKRNATDFVGALGALKVELTDNKFKDMVSNLNAHVYKDGRVTHEMPNSSDIINRTILNLVLYINQPDPELTPVAPNKNLSQNKLIQLRNRADQGSAVYNSCTMPVTFINWRWMRPITPHMVSGHFRWQPHGPQNLLRKLIWIDSFEKGVPLNT